MRWRALQHDRRAPPGACAAASMRRRLLAAPVPREIAPLSRAIDAREPSVGRPLVHARQAATSPRRLHARRPRATHRQDQAPVPVRSPKPRLRWPLSALPIGTGRTLIVVRHRPVPARRKADHRGSVQREQSGVLAMGAAPPQRAAPPPHRAAPPRRGEAEQSADRRIGSHLRRALRPRSVGRPGIVPPTPVEAKASPVRDPRAGRPPTAARPQRDDPQETAADRLGAALHTGVRRPNEGPPPSWRAP